MREKDRRMDGKEEKIHNFQPGEPIANILVMPFKSVLAYMSFGCGGEGCLPSFLPFSFTFLFSKMETFIAFAGFFFCCFFFSHS